MTFIAPQETAFSIHRILGPGRGDGSLKYCWWLNASFQDDGSFQYTLEPNDVRIPGRRCWPFPAWRKASMTDELKRLAALLAKVQKVEPA